MSQGIPLKDVRNALMCAIVKQKTAGREISGIPHARVGAFTYYAPLTTVTCRNVRRGYTQRRFGDAHFGPMFRGDMDRVLERTRYEHGLAEVRRTWHAGMRDLKAEFATGVMR